MIWKEIRSFKETLEERKGPQEEVAPSIEGALHQGLEDKFNKTLEQERKPEEPKISIKIFYSPHGSAKDLKGLKEEFAKCDIFIPEGYAWTKGDL